MAASNRGTAKLGVHQKAALWKDMVNDAKSHPDPQFQAKMRTIVSDRLWPKLKPATPPLEITVPDDATMKEKLDLLINAAMTGASIDAVTAVMDALSKAHSIEQVTIMREEMAAIQEQLKAMNDAKQANIIEMIEQGQITDEMRAKLIKALGESNG